MIEEREKQVNEELLQMSSCTATHQQIKSVKKMFGNFRFRHLNEK